MSTENALPNPHASRLFHAADREFHEHADIVGIAPNLENTDGMVAGNPTVMALSGNLPEGVKLLDPSLAMWKGAWRQDGTDSILAIILHGKRPRARDGYAWLLRPEACLFYEEGLPPLDDRIAINGLQQLIQSARWNAEDSQNAAELMHRLVPRFV